MARRGREASDEVVRGQTLHLVGGTESRAGARAGAWGGWNVLVWWHLLSLDAPTVATVWMWFVARGAGVTVRVGHLAAMFLAVWMLYAADRLMDARKATGLEARHRFHARYGRRFREAIGLAGLGLLPLLTGFRGDELKLYLGLGVVLAGWLAVVHTRAKDQRLPKELVVGLVFAAAVFVPLVAAGEGARVWREGLLFAGICVLNCLSIHAWEHPLAEQGAHGATAFGVRHRGALTAVILVGAVAERTPVAAACGLAAVALYGLGMARTRLSRTALRAAADLMLLTPVLFVR